MRRTKIIATLGPACSSEEIVYRLLTSGVDVFRLNFSHGTHEEHAARLRMIRAIGEETGLVLAVLQDLGGPKLR
ncbi:MAG TPA: pyruvate kinase, partial [Thermoanaerobaculia bacterium]|nr:pyruvate kinase [Thermoanaerobaculia bacterium]